MKIAHLRKRSSPPILHRSLRTGIVVKVVLAPSSLASSRPCRNRDTAVSEPGGGSREGGTSQNEQMSLTPGSSQFSRLMSFQRKSLKKSIVVELEPHDGYLGN